MFHVRTNHGVRSRNLRYGTAFLAVPQQYLQFGLQACWNAHIGLFTTFQVDDYKSVLIAICVTFNTYNFYLAFNMLHMQHRQPLVYYLYC